MILDVLNEELGTSFFELYCFFWFLVIILLFSYFILSGVLTYSIVSGYMFHIRTKV